MSIAEDVRPRLLARHEDIAVEDNDGAVAAACDALHQQLVGGGEDVAGGRVELRSRIHDEHVLVTVAVVRLEEHRQPEPLRVRVGAADVTRLVQPSVVGEAASGRDGVAELLEQVRRGVLVESDRRRTQGV